MPGLLHHVSELAGEQELSLPGNGDRFDEQEISSPGGPGETGGDADAGGQRRPVGRVCIPYGIDDRQARAHGALRIILIGARPAEIAQHAVAHELGDEAFESTDGAGARVLIGAQNLPHVLRVEPSRQRRRAHEIAE